MKHPITILIALSLSTCIFKCAGWSFCAQPPRTEYDSKYDRATCLPHAPENPVYSLAPNTAYTDYASVHRRYTETGVDAICSPPRNPDRLQYRKDMRTLQLIRSDIKHHYYRQRR